LGWHLLGRVRQVLPFWKPLGGQEPNLKEQITVPGIMNPKEQSNFPLSTLYTSIGVKWFEGAM
jgi:hypothetical protein